MDERIALGDQIGLKIADLALWLNAGDSSVRLEVPSGHGPFVVPGEPACGLSLHVRDRSPVGTDGWRPVFHDAATWQLWRDEAGRHVFVAPAGSPPRRQIAIDAAFTTGEVIGEFATRGAGGQAVYPLQDIDMAIFSNWLTATGDLIIHASGIDDEGAGYAFVGPSGAGKSTLVSALAAERGVAVLGEDTVIVRRQEDRFILYGTPWHSNPALCSPGGVRLAKLFFLDRGMEHGVRVCGARTAAERLLQDAVIPFYNRVGVERALDSLVCLAEQVRCYTLSYELGADVLWLIRGAR